MQSQIRTISSTGVEKNTELKVESANPIYDFFEEVYLNTKLRKMLNGNNLRMRLVT
jgi:hypothetical protein